MAWDTLSCMSGTWRRCCLSTGMCSIFMSVTGLSPYPMYFFHVNGRHHSFAMIGTGRRGLHHFMVEYQNLDDVGQGYDACPDG